MDYISVNLLARPNEDDIKRIAFASRLSFKNTKITTFNEDLLLLSKLIKLGDDEAKSLRGIDITYLLNAPRYFWHEFVTYRIGNEQLGSQSTMHSAPKFETEQDFIEYKRSIIEGTFQLRMFKTSYQTLRRMYYARRNHRLPEWKEFCKWIEKLPYAKELILIEKGNK